MKKLFALILAAAMLTAIFSAAVSVNSYNAAAFSIDWYAIDGNLITVNGNVDQLIKNNKPKYAKNSDDPENDTILFFGWVQLEGPEEIKAIGYKIDDNDPVYDDNFFTRLTEISMCHVDRTQELLNAKLPNAEGYVLQFSYADLSDGDHTVSFMVKGDDDVDCAFYKYGFTVVPAGSSEPARIIGTWIDEQTSAEKISLYNVIDITGWTGANYEIEDIGYRIDNEEPVFGDGSVTIIPVEADDPVKSTDIGGGKYAERFIAHIDLEPLDLSDGAHTLAIYIKVADDNETVLKIHKTGDGWEQGAIIFNYGDFEDHEYDLWLCEKADSFATGWWMHPESTPDFEEYNINIVFSTPNAFNGFMMACFASGTQADAAELQINLLDEDDVLLEEHEITVLGDHNTKEAGFIKVRFDKSYDKGIYTIEIVLNNGQYFVLGSGDYNEISDYSYVDGFNVPQVKDDEHGYIAARAPAVKLLGVKSDAADTELEDTETEPEETGPSETETDAVDTDGPDETAGPVETEPEDTEPGETEPEDTEPGETEPEDTEPDGTEPEETEPEETEPEETEPEIGDDVKAKDINGDGAIDNKDVVVLFRYVSGVEKEEDEAGYDVNGDGEVDNKDVVILFRLLSAFVIPAEPETAEPEETGSDETETEPEETDEEPEETEPEETEPEETGTEPEETDPEPEETEPEETEPEETEPEETEPEETEPEETADASDTSGDEDGSSDRDETGDM